MVEPSDHESAPIGQVAMGSRQSAVGSRQSAVGSRSNGAILGDQSIPDCLLPIADCLKPQPPAHAPGASCPTPR
ncbi:MAG: hypothetical protein EPO59_04285 [Bosea sp. (in: a-proteobacteria)]|nr:MAG: hypothetical protein EPO59_04285 [Bosea sp. (in: a-proteobacteria)]